MGKEDVLLFTCYGKKGSGKSYMEHLKAKDKEIGKLKMQLENLEKLNNANYQSFIETNNIINELEKYLIEEIEDYDKHINSRYITDIAREQYEGEKVCFEDTLGKLQELKGNNEPSFEEMIGFIENVYKDIKSQSTLHEELEEERKTIAKIIGDFKEVNK